MLPEVGNLSAVILNNSRDVLVLAAGDFKHMPARLKSLREHFSLHFIGKCWSSLVCLLILHAAWFVSSVEILSRVGLNVLALLVPLEEVIAWKSHVLSMQRPLHVLMVSIHMGPSKLP